MSRDRVSRAPAVLVVLLVTMVTLGGCGSAGSSATSGSDPASIVPTGSAAYFSAVVRPSGSLGTGAVTAAREITRLGNPFGDLLQAIDRYGSTRGTSFSYAQDVAPWLGSRVGIFVDAPSGTNGAASSGPAVAVLADSTDSTKAMAFIDKSLRQDSGGQAIVTHSYRGISYDSFGSSGREAGGIIKGFAVFGTAAGVRDAIDTASGGAPLIGNPSYQSSGVANATGALATGYMNLDSLLRVLAAGASPEAQVFGLSLGQATKVRTVGMTFSATGGSLALDMLSSGASGASGSSGSSTSGVSAAHALAGLPADAWLGLGIGDLHAGLTSSLGANAATEQALFALLDSRLHGLRIERDILPWVGAAGLFISGDTRSTLGGALVIHSTSPAASKAAVSKIRAALASVRGLAVRPASVPGADAGLSFRPAGSGVVVYVIDGNGRFAVALGAQAAAQALRPSQTLGGSSLYQAASSELGAGVAPTLLVSIPAIARLVLPNLPPATAAKARPYLGAFTVLAAGEQRSAGRATARLVLGLH